MCLDVQVSSYEKKGKKARGKKKYGELGFQIHPDSHAAFLHSRNKYGPVASVSEAVGPAEPVKALFSPRQSPSGVS